MVIYTTKPGNHALKTVSTRKLLGTRVVNLQEEHLGEISDVSIDWEAGCIAYVTLAYSPFLGVSKKLFAIPWEAFSNTNKPEFLRNTDRRLILNIPLKALKESEGFEQQPDKPDYAWLRKIYEKYGLKPYWENQ